MFTHMHLYLHEEAEYQCPAMCSARGCALNGCHHLGMAGGATYACRSTANGHQIGCGCCLYDHGGLLGRLGHGWIQWWLCGSAWIWLIGLCGRIARLWWRHCAVWRWLFALHCWIDLYLSFSFSLSFSLSLCIPLSLCSSTARLAGCRSTELAVNYTRLYLTLLLPYLAALFKPIRAYLISYCCCCCCGYCCCCSAIRLEQTFMQANWLSEFLAVC